MKAWPETLSDEELVEQYESAGESWLRPGSVAGGKVTPTGEMREMRVEALGREMERRRLLNLDPSADRDDEPDSDATLGLRRSSTGGYAG